jgi:hypothetical protein
VIRNLTARKYLTAVSVCVCGRNVVGRYLGISSRCTLHKPCRVGGQEKFGKILKSVVFLNSSMIEEKA